MWSHHFMANRRGKKETVTDFIFLGSKITVDGDCRQVVYHLCHLGRLVNRTSALFKRPQRARLPFLPAKEIAKRRPPMNQEMGSNQIPNLLKPWIWTSILRNWEKCLSLWFCYISLHRKRHIVSPDTAWLHCWKANFMNFPILRNSNISPSAPCKLVRMRELDCKESWAPKNWCFCTVVLEKTQVPWTARRSNQSILKEISPEYSLEGLTLKLKL